LRIRPADIIGTFLVVVGVGLYTFLDQKSSAKAA
jgi:hypothetical protein